MGVVAPISATAAVVPLVVGVAGGDRPGGLQYAGIALALVGVVLASREEVGGRLAGGTARGAGLALLSALGFGLFFVCMDRASDEDVAWAILVNRCHQRRRCCWSPLRCCARRSPWRRADLGVLVAVGTLDIAANAMFAVASTEDLVSLVSVLASLYPITTVGLAAVVLGERPHRWRRWGWCWRCAAWR